MFDMLQVVIGNILERRKQEVVVVTEREEGWLRLTDEQLVIGGEIEKLIIENLKDRHDKWQQIHT